MDSNSDEALSDEIDSTIGSYELHNSSCEDDDSLIEEIDKNPIDEWQWKIDNLRFFTFFHYFDEHALGNSIIRLINTFSKFMCQDVIKIIIDQINIYEKQHYSQIDEDATT